MANPTPTRVITGEVRLSYAHLFVPYVNPNSTDKTPKYSVTLLIPKSDTVTMQNIQAAIQAATAAGVPKVWAQQPPQPKTPIWDGDGVRSSGEPFGPEARGCWVMTVSTKLQPQVVDANLQPVINQSEIYSGMYAQVSVNFFAYSNSGNKGIGAGLGNVKKTRDGESLAGGKTAEEDFGSTDVHQVQYAPPAQPPQYAPQTYMADPNAQQPLPAQPQYAPPVQQPQYSPPAQQYPAQAPQQYAAVDPMTGLPIA